MQNEKENSEYFMLIPTYNAPKLTNEEFILVMAKGKIHKPVILLYPRTRFEKKLKYYKKLSWN